MENKANFDEKAEKLNDEIKFLQVRITELEKAEGRRQELEDILKEDERRLRVYFRSKHFSLSA